MLMSPLLKLLHSSATQAWWCFLSPNFQTLKEPKNRFQETNSARLRTRACRYENSIPTRFLAPIDCLKIQAQFSHPSIVLFQWQVASCLCFLLSGADCTKAQQFILYKDSVNSEEVETTVYSTYIQYHFIWTSWGVVIRREDGTHY